jgi:hypothetical protein
MKTTERLIKEYIAADGKSHFRIWHDGLKEET